MEHGEEGIITFFSPKFLANVCLRRAPDFGDEDDVGTHCDTHTLISQQDTATHVQRSATATNEAFLGHNTPPMVSKPI